MAMSRSFGATSFTTRSPIRISPSVISSRPATIRSAVVCPQPDGPTSTIRLPSGTSRSRCRTARVPSANTFVTPSNTIWAMGSVLLCAGRGSVDLDGRVLEAHEGDVLAARSLEEQDDRARRAGVGERRAVPDAGVHHDARAGGDTEHLEPIEPGEPAGILRMFGRRDVDQAAPVDGDDRFETPHVPLGPVEPRSGRLEVQVPDAPRPAIALQQDGLGPPRPSRAVRVPFAGRALDQASVRAERVGGEVPPRQRHAPPSDPSLRTPAASAAARSNSNEARASSRGGPASPDGRSSALSRFASVFVAAIATSFVPGVTRSVTSTS